MKISIIMESISIPKFPPNFVLELPQEEASVSDVITSLAEQGLTGALALQDVLSSHIFIRNGSHVKPEDMLHDGDKLIVMKTLLGG